MLRIVSTERRIFNEDQILNFFCWGTNRFETIRRAAVLSQPDEAT